MRAVAVALTNSLSVRQRPSFISSMSNAVTLVPASYPDLVDEQWSAICGDEERQTLIPMPQTQMGLELACAGLEAA